MDLSKKHRRTLQRVFAHPLPANLKWREVEGLLRALGATLEERAGARVAIILPGAAPFVHHRTHGEPALDKGSVAEVRDLLKRHGIKP